MTERRREGSERPRGRPPALMAAELEDIARKRSLGNRILLGQIDFDLTEELGSGSDGTVYRAKWQGAEVAAKVLHPILIGSGNSNLLGRRQFLERFLCECALLKDNVHPNVVQCLGMGCTREGGPAILMELMDDNLASRVSAPVADSQRQSLIYLRDIAAGLAYIHSQNILHRDVKPSNCFIRSGRAKLGDLGVARQMDEYVIDGNFTRCPGTHNFMAPEAMTEGTRYGKPLDIFGMGLTVLCVFIRGGPGRSSFFAPRVRITDGLEEAIPEVERRREELAALPANHFSRPIIIQCISNDPAHRPTAVCLLETLEELLQVTELEPPQGVSGQQETTPAPAPELPREQQQLPQEQQQLPKQQQPQQPQQQQRQQQRQQRPQLEKQQQHPDQQLPFMTWFQSPQQQKHRQPEQPETKKNQQQEEQQQPKQRQRPKQQRQQHDKHRVQQEHQEAVHGAREGGGNTECPVAESTIAASYRVGMLTHYTAFGYSHQLDIRRFTRDLCTTGLITNEDIKSLEQVTSREGKSEASAQLVSYLLDFNDEEVCYIVDVILPRLGLHSIMDTIQSCPGHTSCTLRPHELHTPGGFVPKAQPSSVRPDTPGNATSVKEAAASSTATAESSGSSRADPVAESTIAASYRVSMLKHYATFEHCHQLDPRRCMRELRAKGLITNQDVKSLEQVTSREGKSEASALLVSHLVDLNDEAVRYVVDVILPGLGLHSLMTTIHSCPGHTSCTLHPHEHHGTNHPAGFVQKNQPGSVLPDAPGNATSVKTVPASASAMAESSRSRAGRLQPTNSVTHSPSLLAAEADVAAVAAAAKPADACALAASRAPPESSPARLAVQPPLVYLPIGSARADLDGRSLEERAGAYYGALKKHIVFFRQCEQLQVVDCLEILTVEDYATSEDVDQGMRILSSEGIKGAVKFLHATLLGMPVDGICFFVEHVLESQIRGDHHLMLTFTLCPGPGGCPLNSAEPHSSGSSTASQGGDVRPRSASVASNAPMGRPAEVGKASTSRPTAAGQPGSRPPPGKLTRLSSGRLSVAAHAGNTSSGSRRTATKSPQSKPPARMQAASPSEVDRPPAKELQARQPSVTSQANSTPAGRSGAGSRQLTTGMSPIHKVVLRKCRVEIIANLDVKDHVLERMYADYILPQHSRDHLYELTNPHHQATYLLDMLPRCGKKAFGKFIGALEGSEKEAHRDLAVFLLVKEQEVEDENS